VQPDTDAAASESREPDFEELMIRYQQADPAGTTILIKRLSPRLHRFFATQLGSRTDADDMLQELWLRIHRVRHTYRAGEPFLPWVYAIAHRVRIDGYRRRQRLSREIGVDVLPEFAMRQQKENSTLPFDELLAKLPESQREVLTMLKVDGLSIEEIARATSSTAGAVKQKAHRAYQRLRSFLEQTADARKTRKGVGR
jgi:RNA polymerase sigma-70 factor, ECF subfamily